MKAFEILAYLAIAFLFVGALVEGAIGSALFGTGLGLFVLSLIVAYLDNHIKKPEVSPS